MARVKRLVADADSADAVRRHSYSPSTQAALVACYDGEFSSLLDDDSDLSQIARMHQFKQPAGWGLVSIRRR